MSSPAARDLKAPLALVTVLFVLSGAAALTHELVWLRRLALIWGGTAAAQASALASFLGCLALGARLAAQRADRSRNPLLGYALCELGAAVFAALSPWTLTLLASWAANVYPHMEARGVGSILLRAGMSLAVVGPTAVLLGASFPLGMRLFALCGYSNSRAAAWLHAWNALGGALGVWLAGFFLMPTLGLGWAGGLAAATQVAVAAFAWMLIRDFQAVKDGGLLQSQKTLAASTPVTPEKNPSHLGWLSLAVFLQGAAGLMLQVTWARELALLVGGTTYALSALLAAVVAAWAIGCLIFRVFWRAGHSILIWTCAASVLAAGSAYLGRLMESELAIVIGALREMRSDSMLDAMLCLGAALVLVGPSAAASGVLAPAMVEWARRAPARAARTAGGLHAWNTAGAMLGVILAASFALPRWGSAGLMAIGIGLYAAALASAVFAGNPSGGEAPATARPWPGIVVAAVIVVMAVVSGLQSPDPLRTNLGLYLYGSHLRSKLGDTELLYFRSGAASNVLVTEAQVGGGRSIRSLRVNGKVDGSDGEDMRTQLALAYVPHLLRPAAKNVLVVGHGTGTTAGASLRFPESQVVGVEIEPAILEASKQFSHVNGEPLLSARFEAVVDDARSYVQGSPVRFDLVLSEPSNPWIAGVSHLYTVEFYEQVLGRLEREGIFAQWLQTYALSAEQVALVVRSLQRVFPQLILVRINEYDTLILASRVPLIPKRAEIDRSQARVDALEAVGDDLEKYFSTRDVRAFLLEHVLLEGPALARFAQDLGQDVHRDLDLKLEFGAPRKLFDQAAGARGPSDMALISGVDVALVQKLITGWGFTDGQGEALRRMQAHYRSQALLQKSIELGLVAGIYQREDPQFFADELLWDPPLDPTAYRAAAEHLVQLSLREAHRVARSLGARREPARARILYLALLRRFPESATLHASMALVNMELGLAEDAKIDAKQALAMDPLSDYVQRVAQTLGLADSLGRRMPDVEAEGESEADSDAKSTGTTDGAPEQK